MVGQCNAAHALIGFISSAHYSPFLDSELLAALTPGASLPAFFWRSHTYQHCGFLLELLQLVYLHCSIWPPSANASLTPDPRLQTSYPFSAHFVFSPSASAPPPHAPDCFSLPPDSSSLSTSSGSYSCKQNFVTICNLLSQDSITIYTAYTEHHYI